MNRYEVQWVAGQRGQLRTEEVRGDYYRVDDSGALIVVRDGDDEPVLTVNGLPFIVRRIDADE